jgi:hypothetical protein
MRGSRTDRRDKEDRRTRLESRTIEGDSPVFYIGFILVGILSSMGLETPCVKQPAPSGKAKYSPETDSGIVP